MIILLLGLFIFLGMHTFAAVRSRADGNIAQRMGVKYKGLFALVSLIGLGVIIYGYGLARVDPYWSTPLWIAPEWTRHLIIALMPISVVLLVAADMRTKYIARYIKHPMLNGVKIWASLHMIYNGDWPSIALFGGFLAYASLSRTMARLRKDNGKQHPEASFRNDILAIFVGLLVYVSFVFYIHEWLIGRPVLV